MFPVLSGLRKSIDDTHQLFVAGLSLLAAFANAETLTGRVIKVADGDTVTMLDESNVQRKIRLSGIDAPERKQPYGAASKKNVATIGWQGSDGVVP